MTEEAQRPKGPITEDMLTSNLPPSRGMEPTVLGHVVDGLNELVSQLSAVWLIGHDIRETMCGLLLADPHGYHARIMPPEQCAHECTENKMPEEHCATILAPAPPGVFMITIVTDRLCVVFGLPVRMIRLNQPGSENN